MTDHATSFRYLSSGRFWMAGPVTLIIAVFIMAAMSLWFPKGQAGIDHLVFPLVLFPLIWATVFFYVVLDRHLKRVGLVMLLLFLMNGLPVIASVLGWIK